MAIFKFAFETVLMTSLTRGTGCRSAESRDCQQAVYIHMLLHQASNPVRKLLKAKILIQRQPQMPARDLYIRTLSVDSLTLPHPHPHTLVSRRIMTLRRHEIKCTAPDIQIFPKIPEAIKQGSYRISRTFWRSPPIRSVSAINRRSPHYSLAWHRSHRTAPITPSVTATSAFEVYRAYKSLICPSDIMKPSKFTEAQPAAIL